MSKFGTRKSIFHAVTVAFLIASVCFSVFRFAPVFGRLLDALGDLARSVAYYFLYMVKLERLVTPTIGIFPEDMETILPITLEEFEKLMTVYGEILTDISFIEEYLDGVGVVIGQIAQTLLMLVIPTVALLLVLILVYRERDNNYNQDTKPLRFWRRVKAATWDPIKFYVKKYFRFVKNRKWYLRALIVLWLYNLNVITIAIEALAWFFYFAVSWDLVATLVFIAKFAADFTVPLFFIPVPVWALIGYKVFDLIRCSIGIKKIKAAIEKIVKFLKEHIGAIFIHGKQRSKKTSLLTQFKIVSECCIHRPAAKEGMANRIKQFPNFPWIVYDRFIIDARKRHDLYGWSGIHELFLFLKWADSTKKIHCEAQLRTIQRHLRRRWGYEFEDYCFGYDRRKYGATFDTALEFVTIYDALEAYGKQLLFYTQPTPMDASNYPIRSDFYIADEGNLPEFKVNLTEKSTKKSFQRSQYSHRINRDMFRLGPQFKPNNPENNAFEYGQRISMENGKERGNQLTRRYFDKQEGMPNPDNDLTELESKIHTHVATCDNHTYFDDYSDEQREGSVGADQTDLMTKIYIRKAHGVKFYVPFFAIDEAIYLAATAIFDLLYFFIRKKKGSNTALIAFLWKLYTPIYRHYIRYYNFFSYYPLETKISDGADNEVLAADKRLPLIALVAYRGRFRTDGLGEFYYQKNRSALLGLNDVPMYKTKSMSLVEMDEQESHMIKQLTKHFRGSWRNPLAAMATDKEKKTA